MPSQRRFGGGHTERKLDAVASYLESFLQALSKQPLRTYYIDAFAGSGTIPMGAGGELFEGIGDAREFMEGSALRALKLSRKFDEYVFIEKDRKKLDELRTVVSTVTGAAERTNFVRGDANEEILKLCPTLSKPASRSVVFFDPFGSQVQWSTLEALAKTQHVDLWYLYPAGQGVNRQIAGDGRTTVEQEDSLNRMFGPHDWREALLAKEPVHDLFDRIERTYKTAGIDQITRFMIACMKTIFKGDVLDNWLPLGRDGAHWYSLIFAMANPGAQAKKIGHEIAKHIMTRK
jgi:three-Cys-motif partner protein